MIEDEDGLFMSYEKPIATHILPATLEHFGSMRSGKRPARSRVGDAEINPPDVNQVGNQRAFELTNAAWSVLIAGKKPVRAKGIRLTSPYPIHPLAEVSPSLWSPNYLMVSVTGSRAFFDTTNDDVVHVPTIPVPPNHLKWLGIFHVAKCEVAFIEEEAFEATCTSHA
jgi:hypothetical protein